MFGVQSRYNVLTNLDLNIRTDTDVIYFATWNNIRLLIYRSYAREVAGRNKSGIEGLEIETTCTVI